MKQVNEMTLKEYLDYLEKEWSSFSNPLYTLENYLAMGVSVWKEENAEIGESA